MPGKLLEYITDMPRVVGGIDEGSPSTTLHFDKLSTSDGAQDKFHELKKK